MMEKYDVDKEYDREGKRLVAIFTLPKIETRLPIKRNAFYLRPERNHWTDWVFAVSLMTKDVFSKIKDLSLLAAYCFPICDDLKRYEILTKYSMLMVVYDDHTEQQHLVQSDVDNFKMSLEQTFCTLEGKEIIGMSDWKPYVMALYAIWRDISLTFNDFQKKRLIKYHRLYVIGTCEQAEFELKHFKYNSLEELIQSRNKSVGMFAYIQTIEYALNVFVPEHIWESEIWQNYLIALSTYSVYINDIYSFEREFIECNERIDRMHNCVAIISLTKGISIEQAMNTLLGLMQDKENEVLQTSNEIIIKFEFLPVVKAFINGCKLMSGGVFGLHVNCTRYNMK